jgi:hypothetical protein
MLSSAAWAESGNSDRNNCNGNGYQQGCGSEARSTDDMLRALRLRNAVQNGDMTEDEARKQAARRHGGGFFPSIPHSNAVHGDEIAPDRRFWREQRRQTLNPGSPARRPMNQMDKSNPSESAAVWRRR